MLKLNIGCSTDKRDDYLNIDIREEVKPDVVMDIRYLQDIKDESCDEIMANHVIEHFQIRVVPGIINVWKSKLKIGGKLIIRCPDLISIAERIISNPDDQLLSQHLFGAQDHPWNYHCCGFTEKTLKKLLRDKRFKIISSKTDYPNLEVIAEKNA